MVVGSENVCVSSGQTHMPKLPGRRGRLKPGGVEKEQNRRQRLISSILT